MYEFQSHEKPAEINSIVKPLGSGPNPAQLSIPRPQINENQYDPSTEPTQPNQTFPKLSADPKRRPMAEVTHKKLTMAGKAKVGQDESIPDRAAIPLFERSAPCDSREE